MMEGSPERVPPRSGQQLQPLVKDVITHDPRQVIEDTRAYLAAHDRHIAFLFGAGTSSSINLAVDRAPGTKPMHEPLIPGTKALTERCATAVSAIGSAEENAWTHLVDQCNTEDREPNVEDVLSRVRLKIQAMGDGEESVGLSKAQLRMVEATICRTIATTVTPPESTIPADIPHNEFAAWIGKIRRAVPIEIFTTNYDILLERALEASRIPIFDGFVGSYRPFFYPEGFDDEALLNATQWVRLWKLHGSVNWSTDEHTRTRIVRDRPSVTGEMILPSHRKYDESRKQPYIAYMDRLSGYMRKPHAVMIACGYSFSDDHINAILFDALEANRTINLIALQYDDISDSSDLVRTAQRLPNLTVLGPNAGVIAGKLGAWLLTQPVDDRTAPFMDVAFDSEAEPEASGVGGSSAQLRGRLRLGDFKWLCKFLNAMSFGEEQ